MGDEAARPGESQDVEQATEQEAPHTEQLSSREESHAEGSESDEGPPPPLPPRPTLVGAVSTSGPSTGSGPTITPGAPSRTPATIALSSVDIHTQTYQDGSRDHFSTLSNRPAVGERKGLYSGLERYLSRSGSETGDSNSIRSYAPTLSAAGDVESLLGEVLNGGQSPAWKLLGTRRDSTDPFDDISYEDQDFEVVFAREFDELPPINEDGGNEESLLEQWRSRLKHFIILSSAGKPIYSRHGDQNLISSYIGVIQTIISLYESLPNALRSFTAGSVRFVILTQGPLHLVAISRLPSESASQLLIQLESLYMQVLSTLTLPALTSIFSNRPSTDLRRPLDGTEPLLSALADSFTLGSPSTLLCALECLTLRKTHRQAITATILKHRPQHGAAADLLYGLVVAGGRLVSVIRPRKHSLHPSDLQLIFNMLFQSGGVKAAGGESWIPLCLPGFNNKGYLYMYVSFLPSTTTATATRTPSDATSDATDPSSPAATEDDQIAIILISPSRDAFFPLQKARNAIVADLEASSLLAQIRAAIAAGRRPVTDIAPGTVIRHFLYKSRANVQFVMPAYAPQFVTPIAKRRLLTTYQSLHSNLHAPHSHTKVHLTLSTHSTSLGWLTPTFELYCVAGPNASRQALAQGANRVVRWAREAEARIFILGGGTF